MTKAETDTRSRFHFPLFQVSAGAAVESPRGTCPFIVIFTRSPFGSGILSMSRVKSFSNWDTTHFPFLDSTRLISRLKVELPAGRPAGGTSCAYVSCDFSRKLTGPRRRAHHPVRHQHRSRSHQCPRGI
jgi:hypothetical protein